MAKVSLRAYNREIEAMIDRSHLDEAVAHCQHILKTFPKHIETYRLLGKAYLEARRHNEAVDIFSRVLAADPNDFVAHVGLSIIRDEQNKLDDAIWHMERAFEVQSANPAIQGELQRLYGRRDGVPPSRIRMTRGALAHMYMRGELYPQAISETRNILEEDQGRSDMQVLRARAFFRSGQKNDAADAASTVLKRYPYCLDANLVLAEILGIDRPESAQIYRQRVIELDPYAAQAAEDMFRASEVSDAAVSIEHLDWNGQPVGMTPDWSSSNAIALESGLGDREAQPEWMKSAFADETPPSAPAFAPEQGTSAAPALAAEDIPDFLRAAGWGAATGAFDESKASAMFADEPVVPAEPIAQGDLPDWVKAMAPSQTSQPAEETGEEIPDWINKIGTSELPIPSETSTGDQPGWLRDLGQEEQSVQAEPSSGLDWLNSLGQAEVPASESVGEMDLTKSLNQQEPPAPTTSADDLDWLKGLEQEEEAPAPASAVQSDWLKDLGQEEQPVSASTEHPDWLKALEQEEDGSAFAIVDHPEEMKEAGWEEMPTPAVAEQPDWLKELGQEEQPISATTEPPDWLKDLEREEEQPVSATAEQPDWLKDLGEAQPVSTSPEPPDWLKDLEQAEEQPVATTIDQPEWMKESVEEEEYTDAVVDQPDLIKSLDQEPALAQADQPDWLKDLDSEPVSAQPASEPEFAAELTTEPESPSPVADAGSLGVSTQEQDDSFAWLEALAAKQGATEGLLTKPEERLEEEPDWVRQAKSLRQPAEEQPVQEPLLPAEQPSAPVAEVPAKVEELGRSEAERDDSFAWLEALAAKQGATEGLLTKPEERLEHEPDWVKQVKKATGELKLEPVQEMPVEQPVSEELVPEPEPSLPPASLEDLGRSETDRDDSFAWLEALAAKQGATEGLLTKPEERLEQEPDWVKQVKKATGELKPEPVQETLVEQPVSEKIASEPEPVPLPASLEDLGKSEAERDDSFAWLESLAAKQGATEGLLTKPEERLEEEPEWVRQAKDQEEIGIAPSMGMPEEMEAPAEKPVPIPDVSSWLKSLDEPQEQPITPPASADDLPAWIQDVGEEEMPAAEPAVPMEEAESASEAADLASEEMPAWLRNLEVEESTPKLPVADDLPAWMRDETGEVVAEPTKIEPTRASDWAPVDEMKPEPVQPPPPAPPSVTAREEPAPEPKPAVPPKAKKPAPKKEEVRPSVPPEPYREPQTRRMTGMLTMPVDPILASARNELSRSNIPGALETYGKLIKKGRYLEEVIFDLREALYRYPVEVSIWQSLGDAYMRANQLQDALDAYTKAEELLR